jgi:hypothetical protein
VLAVTRPPLLRTWIAAGAHGSSARSAYLSTGRRDSGEKMLVGGLTSEWHGLGSP